MKSKTTRQFRKLFAYLPESIQRQGQEAYQLLREDPSHPGLRFKPIGQRDPSIVSVRVGLRYRAIGVRQTDTVIWFCIGSHAVYDELSSRF